MFTMLMIMGVFAYIAGIFTIRYFIGEKICWYRAYWEREYQILLSRRLDAYLFDTLAVCGLSLLIFSLCFDGGLVSFNMEAAIIGGLTALAFLGARLLEKSYALYSDQGLLLSKPFHHLRRVPWSEIGNIGKRNAQAPFYDVLDLAGHRLTRFPLNKKTQPFLELAKQNGIAVSISQETEMILGASGEKLNGTLGEWDVVLARSAYAQNDVIAFAAFQGFMVALFMDRQLNEDNIIAINQDGTVRWKIPEIIKEKEPVSYTAMTKEDADTIRVMAVRDRQYDCAVLGVNVYEEKIVSQHSGNEV